jgi:XTP/dITP diphosphohydrolase
MKELVFATHNEHKASEVQALLGHSFRVLSLDRAGFFEELPEEQDTLEGNALQKAQYVHDLLSRDCFADDTGLEVRVLGDAPGVYSARYAEMSGERRPGETIPDANIRKLLRLMDHVQDRAARFRTVIALIIDGRQYTFEGSVEGSILTHRLGEAGFGYDPVFQPTGYSQTFAEMSLEQKNRISHRAMAVLKLTQFLKNYRNG